ncbi:MAG TPA: hypothetical protein VLT86_19795 [Vicinamibacterales bacterium]|nr:hypothetical protein [Vicinamibacterales bacterium]
MPTAGYSGTPLVKKLGIKSGMTVAVIGSPKGFRQELVDLPEDVHLTMAASKPADLVIWFVPDRQTLTKGLGAALRIMTSGLWIAWPKKTSTLFKDVTEDHVRHAGLAEGVVDYKVCAINETWSGLKFARRKGSRTGDVA